MNDRLYNLTVTFVYVTILKKEDKRMAVSKEKTGVLVNMDKTLKEELSKLAKEQNRSLNNLIVTILQKYVDSADK